MGAAQNLTFPVIKAATWLSEKTEDIRAQQSEV